MEAAEQLGITIPRLCYHPDLSLAGSCRVCIVEVEGMGFYMASCSVAVWEGMVVRTNSPEIRQARRDIVELLLDNHSKDCQTCERDGNCELQNLAYSLGVRDRLFEGERKQFPIDDASNSVVRNPEKCVLCGRCVRVCAEIQGVNNLSQHGRGFNTRRRAGPHGSHGRLGLHPVRPVHQRLPHGRLPGKGPYGRCLEGAGRSRAARRRADRPVHPRGHRRRVRLWNRVRRPPARWSPPCRRLGFDAVFDTDFAADLTIVEEAHEFLTRLDDGGPLPMITSCSPGWISFMEKFYPALIPHASTCKSPMSMLSTLAKTYYAEKKGIDPAKIYVVAVMPCVAKKYEARRGEHALPGGTPYTDAVLTTRELIWMIKCYGIHFASLEDGEFDAPLGTASGAGDIFGTTGGVMEATLRAASELITGQAGRSARIHRSAGCRGTPRDLRGHWRQEYPPGGGQRPAKRQGPAGQGHRG